MKIRLKCISDHNTPHFLDADEDTAKKLLTRGDYILVGEAGIITEVKDKKEKNEK